MWAVFAKAAEVLNYLKSCLPGMDSGLASIDTKVGQNSDAAGTTTIFARVKQIYDYLTGTVIVRIGANSDAAGTTTIFARVKQIYDYVSGSSIKGVIDAIKVKTDAGAIKSIQRGKVLPTAGTYEQTINVTISAVTQSKAFILINAVQQAGSSNEKIQAIAEFTSNTNIEIRVTADQYLNSGSPEIVWQVVEYN